jgi:hypothetical protein
MKNPLHKIVADYPNNKIEFEWKNDGQFTHIIVDGKRLKVTGVARSLFGMIQKDDVSLDEELYNLLKKLTDALISYK